MSAAWTEDVDAIPDEAQLSYGSNSFTGMAADDDEDGSRWRLSKITLAPAERYDGEYQPTIEDKARKIVGSIRCE